MVKREKTRPPSQGVDQTSRHGPRRESQAGLPGLVPDPDPEEEEKPARLPEDVEDRFRVK